MRRMLAVGMCLVAVVAGIVLVARTADAVYAGRCTQFEAPYFMRDVYYSCKCAPPDLTFYIGLNGCSANGVKIIEYHCLTANCYAYPAEKCLPYHLTETRPTMLIPWCRSATGQACTSAVDCGYWGELSPVMEDVPICFCQ